MPDEVLERVDRLASERGKSRSGFLRDLAERELSDSDEERRRKIRELLDAATAPRGGNSVELIRADRER